METLRATGNRRRNKRRLNVRRFILVILALFVIVGAVIGIVFGLKSCSLAVKKQSLPFSPEAKYAYTGDGFIYMDGLNLRYVSLSDEENNFSEQLEYAPEKLIGTPQLKAIATRSSFRIVNTRHDNSFDGEIRKITAGSNYIAVFVEGNDGKLTLIVYNAAGDRCYTEDYTDRVLLDFGFEGGGSDSFYTSELIIKGDVLSTSIKTRDIRRQSNTGDLYIQGQVVTKVFLTEKSVFAYGTDRIIRFDRKTNTEAYRVLANGYDCTDASWSGGRIVFLLSRSDDRGGPINVLSLKEDSTADESRFVMTGSGESVACFTLSGKVFEVRSDKLVILNNKGAEEKSIPFEGEITGAAKADNNALIVFAGNESILYSVK
ncbi:MAG: hypothetical protein IJM20_03170 [Clostridia bacterium]|nr:hypothetical protein [Clostridia bacterium]